MSIKNFSFSELYTLFRDGEEVYYNRYIKGLEQPINRQMFLGSVVHKALEHPTFRWERALMEGWYTERGQEVRFEPLPELIPNVIQILGKMAHKRLGNPEYCLRAKTKDGDMLIAFLDDVDLKQWVLNEYKTYESENPNSRERWYKGQVLKHKQLMFYNWMLMLSRHRFFRQNWIYAIDISKGTVQPFETQFGIQDVEYIENWAMELIEKIKQNGWLEKRLDSKTRKIIRSGMKSLFAEPVENKIDAL
jgi:hypothetical protein